MYTMGSGLMKRAAATRSPSSSSAGGRVRPHTQALVRRELRIIRTQDLADGTREEHMMQVEEIAESDLRSVLYEERLQLHLAAIQLAEGRAHLGQEKGKAAPRTDGPACPTCLGRHAECGRCPNGPAKDDQQFDRERAQLEKTRWFYDFLRKGGACGGMGHLARHHELCYTDGARREVDAWRASRDAGKGNKGKTGDKGGGKYSKKGKGGKQKGSQRLDNYYADPMPPAAAPALPPPPADAGDDPPSAAQRTRAMVLGLVANFEAHGSRRRKPAAEPAKASPPSRGPTLLRGADVPTPSLRRLTPGYNCRAHVWMGTSGVNVEAVFDTGSTRGSIDKEFLKSLLSDPLSEAAIVHVESIEPITCQGMDRDRVTEINSVAVLRNSFRGEGGRRIECGLELMVFPQSSERLVLSKPQPDDLG